MAPSPETVLRDWVRPRLTPTLLDDLARLDYGMHVEEHRAAVEDLLSGAHLPAELDWVPREVLELASHAAPPPVRLFACTILVRAGATVPSTVTAALVESALALAPDAIEPAVRYLTWCRDREPDPFLTLALMLLDPQQAPALAPSFADESLGVPAWEWRAWRRLNKALGQPVRLP